MKNKKQNKPKKKKEKKIHMPAFKTKFWFFWQKISLKILILGSFSF